MKECVFAYVSSRGFVTGRGKAVLWGCGLLVSDIRWETITLDLSVHFAKADVFSDLNRLYTNNRISECCDSKDFE